MNNINYNYIKQGDCLELMKDIPNKSIDMILCDLPYGVLNKSNKNAKWDSVIPFDELWKHYNRIIKDNGAIVLFSSGMFTANLMLSNPKMWRYNLIWKKGDRTSGFLNANRQPMRNHEDIVVFYKKQPTYNPQMEYAGIEKANHTKGKLKETQTNNCYGEFTNTQTVISEYKYPKSIINIQPEHKDFYHPTQKPTELLEWLIKTYTNENEIVLDNTMGSGSTCVACINTNRHYIGFELEEKYFNIAKERIKNK